MLALYIVTVVQSGTVDTPAAALVNYNTFPFGTNNNLPAQMVAYTSDPEFYVEYVLAAHIFGLLWNVQVFVYFTYIVIAGAAADWYFTPKNKAQAERVAAFTYKKESERAEGERQKNIKKGKEAQQAYEVVPSGRTADGAVYHDRELRSQSRAKVCESIMRTLRFHIGTVVLAALIIAIINFLRLCLEYIDRKTKDSQSDIAKAISR